MFTTPPPTHTHTVTPPSLPHHSLFPLSHTLIFGLTHPTPLLIKFHTNFFPPFDTPFFALFSLFTKCNIYVNPIVNGDKVFANVNSLLFVATQ